MGPGGPPPQQGQPPPPQQSQPPQGALKRSHMSGIMAAQEQPIQPGQKIAGGPGAENAAKVPHLPKISASLLHAPQLQEQMSNNVNFKK